MQPPHVEREQLLELVRREAGLGLGREVLGDELDRLVDDVHRAGRHRVEPVGLAPHHDGGDHEDRQRGGDDERPGDCGHRASRYGQGRPSGRTEGIYVPVRVRRCPPSPLRPAGGVSGCGYRSSDRAVGGARQIIMLKLATMRRPRSPSPSMAIAPSSGSAPAVGGEHERRGREAHGGQRWRPRSTQRTRPGRRHRAEQVALNAVGDTTRTAAPSGTAARLPTTIGDRAKQPVHRVLGGRTRPRPRSPDGAADVLFVHPAVEDAQVEEAGHRARPGGQGHGPGVVGRVAAASVASRRARS